MTHNLLLIACGLLPLIAMLEHGCKVGASSQMVETNYFEIETPKGSMVIRLYDQTPMHRDNFKKLVAEHAYDSTRFHRILSGFMIQGGDPNSRDDDPMNDGIGGPGYTVPAEIHPDLFHKRGALAAARENDQVNPERASSGSQFYIVHGTIYPEDVLEQMQERVRQSTGDSTFVYSASAQTAYTNIGGAPFLDGAYTVFGEVVEGIEVVDNIARIATPAGLAGGQRVPPQVANNPLIPMWMTVRPLPDYQE